MKRHTKWIVSLLQVALLTTSLSLWWSHRNNHLFGNGQWLVGKNSGKFVFYTYGFMFNPLTKGRVNLAEAMGYQELLYATPEGPEQRLEALEFECAVGRGGYLWIELRKEGQRLLGCRLTHRERTPGGFFQYDERGGLVSHTPLDNPKARASDKWNTIHMDKDADEWVLRFGDKEVGRIADVLPPDGHFGFRGAGNGAAPVYVRNIKMHFSDPTRPGKTWTVTESFRPHWNNPALLWGCLLLSALIILLRTFRSYLLARFLSPGARPTFYLSDGAVLVAALFVSLVVPRFISGSHLPGALCLAELGSVVALAIARRRDKALLDTPRPLPLLPTLGSLLLMAALAGYAFHQNGEWLGRASQTIWAKLKNVHPDAFTFYPAQKPAPGPFLLSDETPLVPGQPLFTGPDAYREQDVDVEFTMPANGTFDVVFQQQAYRTKGDPDGERLPLQRRLIRLSTLPDVPWGFAMYSRTTPAPFIPLSGALRPGEKNQLQVRSRKDGVTITLNGTTDTIPGYAPLGFGETGFGVFEERVILHRASVHHASAVTTRDTLLPWIGAFIPLAWAGLLLCLSRPFVSLRIREAFVLSYTTLLLPGVYLVLSLSMDRQALAFVGATRVAWMDLALLGTALSLFHLFPVTRGRLRGAPILANLLFLVALVPLLLFVWDHVLPDNHPLRIKYARTAVAPGGTVQDNKEIDDAWYSNNRLCRANTYLWHQQFGGRSITVPKPDGHVRVFAMGGSQAWGSGAANSRMTYDGLLEKQLQAKGLPVEIHNAGVNGAGVSRVYVALRDLVMGFEPDLVVADVGLNDSAAMRQVKGTERREEYRGKLLQHFRSAVTLCHEKGVDFILSLEAMSTETPLRPDNVLYEQMEAVTREFGYPVLKAFPHTVEKEPMHMLWWDTAHYAPQGHQVFADFLEPAVEEAVRRRLKTQGQ